MEIAILVITSLNLLVVGYFLVYPQLMTFIKFGRNKKSVRQEEKENSPVKKDPPKKLNNEMGIVVNPNKKKNDGKVTEPKKPKTVKEVVQKIEDSGKVKKLENKEM